MTRAFWTLLRNELSNMLRTRTVLFWTFLFPIFLLTVMVAAFGRGSLGTVALEVVDLDRSPESRALLRDIAEGFRSGDPLTLMQREVLPQSPMAQGALRLAIPAGFGQALGAARQATLSLAYDRSGSTAVRAAARMIEGFAVRYGMVAAGGGLPVAVEQRDSGRLGRKLSYREYILTGVLVMTLMSTGILTTAVSIASMREVNAFKMLACLPVSRSDYIGAVAISRILLMLFTAALLLLSGRIFYGVLVPLAPATWLAALAVLCAGALMFLSLGLLIGARVASAASATVLANVVYFPLLFLGDLTVPLNEFSTTAKQLLGILPVHGVVSALRAVMFQGDVLRHQWQLLATTLLWSAAFLIAARLLFRWHKVD